MSEIKGTHLTVQFSRVVDGDTIRVVLPNTTEDESLRILSLDTEESRAGSKPMTPWGIKAKEHAIDFFDGATEVTIEFPSNLPLDDCLRIHRGNFGRLLVYVYRNGVDFQEEMIRAGFSPYFMKYGHASFAGHRLRYEAAEAAAQREHVGVWDQITVNGSSMRDYATLGTWWRLRGRVVDDYRRSRAGFDDLLNTRLDYEAIKQKADAGESATVFTEFGSLSRIGGRNGVIDNRSREMPFSLFIPDIDSVEGTRIGNLLRNRYIGSGDHPNRSYGYATGELSLFRGAPQMTITSAAQISDDVPGVTTDGVRLRIVALLPNPDGRDAGNETVTLSNTGGQPATLDDWNLQDRSGRSLTLSGSLAAGETREITLHANSVTLNNRGDDVLLIDGAGQLHHKVEYTAADVKSGQPITFA